MSPSQYIIMSSLLMLRTTELRTKCYPNLLFGNKLNTSPRWYPQPLFSMVKQHNWQKVLHQPSLHRVWGALYEPATDKCGVLKAKNPIWESTIYLGCFPIKGFVWGENDLLVDSNCNRKPAVSVSSHASVCVCFWRPGKRAQQLTVPGWKHCLFLLLGQCVSFSEK